MINIVWTAKEALACAYCWAEFSNPENRSDTPEQYWLSIDERARQEIRYLVKKRYLVAIARGQAVALHQPDLLSHGQWEAFGKNAGLSQRHRMWRIVRALYNALRASPMAAEEAVFSMQKNDDIKQ